MYDGARLAGIEEVIVVSFNYRLGPFGWFSHPALRSSATDEFEASGNFGTLDQIRALEWVRENIAEFGGDPDNVTIFGESAGGTNVLALLVVEAAQDLFHRAIAQSGSTDSISRIEAENSLTAEVPGQRHSSAEIVVSLLDEAGVVPDRDAARGYAQALPEGDLADFLRGRSAREIIDAYRNPDRRGALEVPRLIRDGALLPIGDWLSEYRAGRFNRVPVMLGSNRDEMKLFLSQDEKLVRRRFGVFYRIRDIEDYERRSRYHSELWTVRAVSRPASAISDSGLADVFAYRFDWDELPGFFGVDLSKLLGAAHGFEIPFVFGNFDLGSSALARMLFDDESLSTRQDLSARMMGYWAEFARNGRPGSGDTGDQLEWQPWATAASPTARVLVLDTPADGGIRLAEIVLSRDHVIAAVDAEPDLGQDEKCELFFDLFSQSPDWSIEEYRAIGRRGCADFLPAVPVR
jgi:para-nitrobenzyl esterase